MEYPYLYVYTVMGYQEVDKVRGTFEDFATLFVYANLEEEAIEKAKKLVKKNFYRISGVREEIDSIRANYINVKEQIGVQKEIVDIFKDDWKK